MGDEMKKAILILMMFALPALLTFTKQAHASLDYNTAYMVRGDNSHVLSIDAFNNYVYNAGETPWLYLKLKYDDLAVSSPLHLHWVWSSSTNPDNTETLDQKFSLAGLTTDKELWNPVPQPWWNNNGGSGLWHVDVNWFNVHGTNGYSSADFTVCGGGGLPSIVPQKCGPVVTPEPVSSTLFLLGGIPLAAAIRRKFKTA